MRWEDHKHVKIYLDDFRGDPVEKLTALLDIARTLRQGQIGFESDGYPLKRLCMWGLRYKTPEELAAEEVERKDQADQLLIYERNLYRHLKIKFEGEAND